MSGIRGIKMEELCSVLWHFSHLTSENRNSRVVQAPLQAPEAVTQLSNEART